MNKRFGESNVPNDLIPDEIAIKTSLIDFVDNKFSCRITLLRSITCATTTTSLYDIPLFYY